MWSDLPASVDRTHPGIHRICGGVFSSQRYLEIGGVLLTHTRHIRVCVCTYPVKEIHCQTPPAVPTLRDLNFPNAPAICTLLLLPTHLGSWLSLMLLRHMMSVYLSLVLSS